MNELQQVAQLAQLLSDATRLQILTVLLERDATVNDLVTVLSVEQPRLSTHLSRLNEAGLVNVEKSGRQRIYHIVNPSHIRRVLTALSQVGTLETSQRSTQAQRQVAQNTPLRQARTCYDHLAGVAGVELLNAMLKRGWLRVDEAGQRPTYLVSESGQQAFASRGINLSDLNNSKSRRLFAFGCPDWTERQPHLGGLLGAAVLDQLITDGFVERSDAGRALTILQPLTLWSEE